MQRAILSTFFLLLLFHIISCEPHYTFYPRRFVELNYNPNLGSLAYWWNHNLEKALWEDGAWSPTHLVKIETGSTTMWKLAAERTDPGGKTWMELDLSTSFEKDGGPLDHHAIPFVYTIFADTPRDDVHGKMTGKIPLQDGEYASHTPRGRNYFYVKEKHNSFFSFISTEHLVGKSHPNNGHGGLVKVGWVLKDSNKVGGGAKSKENVVIYRELNYLPGPNGEDYGLSRVFQPVREKIYFRGGEAAPAEQLHIIRRYLTITEGLQPVQWGPGEAPTAPTVVPINVNPPFASSGSNNNNSPKPGSSNQGAGRNSRGGGGGGRGGKAR